MPRTGQPPPSAESEVAVHDRGHIGAGLGDIGHATQTRDTARACVVGRQSQAEVSEPENLLRQIVGAAHKVFNGIEAIPDTQLEGGGRHELGQAARADRRSGVGAIGALGVKSDASQV